jgi:hypothetical protein
MAKLLTFVNNLQLGYANKMHFIDKGSYIGYYTGYYKDGKDGDIIRDGMGTMEYGDKKYIKKTYSGNWVNNMREGIGYETYTECEQKNKCGYLGEWKKDKKNGKGKMIYAKGDVYEGVYEGDWVNDMKHGKGIMQYKNGDIYEGDWRDDEKEGNGEMKYKDGRVYNGSWLNDKPRESFKSIASKLSSIPSKIISRISGFTPKKRPSSKTGGYKRKTRRNHNTRNR